MFRYYNLYILYTIFIYLKYILFQLPNLSLFSAPKNTVQQVKLRTIGLKVQIIFWTAPSYLPSVGKMFRGFDDDPFFKDFNESVRGRHGNMLGGDMLGGDMLGGDMLGGDMLGGDMLGGDMVRDMMNNMVQGFGNMVLRFLSVFN